MLQTAINDTKNQCASYSCDEALRELKHYLPAQSTLKDFIHHNTLHAFQHLKFHDALNQASEIFGYKVYMTLDEYRKLYRTGLIREDVLRKIVIERKGPEPGSDWIKKMLQGEYESMRSPRVGILRSYWKKQYKVDLDSLVHPGLFRTLCSYLDQGISMWNFPVVDEGFILSLRALEQNSFTSFLRTERARGLFMDRACDIDHLLKILVGDKSLFKQYLFDQQFAHPGWSGIVSVIEDHPDTLLDRKKISLQELVHLELLMEVDALDFQFGERWEPLGTRLKQRPEGLFDEIPLTEFKEVLALWQEAYEWSYYDDVLAGIQMSNPPERVEQSASFQAMFCLDDRECSIRRYLEKTDIKCETFGTAGFFGVEFFFKPEHGKFFTKLCPAPMTPRHLIKETGTKGKRNNDLHFTRHTHTHTLFKGWLISQTLGFVSAFKLFINIFRPSMSPATASSFRHMDKVSKLTIENKNPNQKVSGLQVGFTRQEMAERVEALLKSIGLIQNFAPIIYVIGHGSSSVNNPHYAAYDCGACSGRPGSVNARVVCYMANHPSVRQLLLNKGLNIPASTQFLGGLHDTARDEIIFYDEDSLTGKNLEHHKKNEIVFGAALKLNAKERSRKFDSINSTLPIDKIHEKVKLRSVSLFEPRPELNHATNALCIVARREFSKGVFLDRRSFLNSYNYAIDPEGKYLHNILNAVTPVCGGINLEYYFSRVDNQKLGAGTKLPHNVMGLFGVANGIEGDLRPGLPSQMIEVHDPVRLLIIVEHFPDTVLQTIRQSLETYEWFQNEWIHLIVAHPETKVFFLFREGAFVEFTPLKKHISIIDDITPVIENTKENIPVLIIRSLP